MSREFTSWKIVVVALAALVGAGLGVDGAHAPRLNSAISGIGVAPAPAPASGSRTGGAIGDRQPQDSTRPAAPAPPASAGAPTEVAGPLLSETRYGPYAYQVYPAVPSAETDRALTGFRIEFRRVNRTAVDVTVADVPDGTTQSATFNASDRLYFIETRMGDDGIEGETNLGDDGFVLTDADGHILTQ